MRRIKRHSGGKTCRHVALLGLSLILALATSLTTSGLALASPVHHRAFRIGAVNVWAFNTS
jgi:hypothetical protein